ncbi:sel1 repeat family protein [Bradyrhizobium sp. INPA01-394B]|uniref:Sel1 repeat family protein n=1 Tax=Bradyrhizobium campsiandrae TaxID=1729892 RepID=A0ABR7U9M2_9BRAD|nr:tetratricopeptide repeat protein [Bradyrhizobium campsiandrae]MBC9879626.1 sel1 repeat family protein [Bradyrhizobium campsiandrae]MBC9980769.1 sel1 repeat family protein [Bradyrhizobium campsiandrae]
MNKLVSCALLAITLLSDAAPAAKAEPLGAGNAAFNRGDYNRAAQLLLPAAERGNARAQGLVGFMYATGQGLPQSYDAAAYWYRLSAEQGNTTAQYLLGLAYDKGQGVPADDVAAYKWLNLAAARAPKPLRENYARLRNAVASKMSRGQIEAGQWHALRWPSDSPF